MSVCAMKCQRKKHNNTQHTQHGSALNIFLFFSKPNNTQHTTQAARQMCISPFSLLSDRSLSLPSPSPPFLLFVSTYVQHLHTRNTYVPRKDRSRRSRSWTAARSPPVADSSTRRTHSPRAATEEGRQEAREWNGMERKARKGKRKLAQQETGRTTQQTGK